MYEDISWLAKTPGLEDVRQSYVERALMLFQRLEAEKDKDADIRNDLAALSRRMSTLYSDWGKYDEAYKYAQQAVELFEKSAKAEAFTGKTYMRWATAMTHISELAHLRQDTQTALDWSSRAMEVLERIHEELPENQGAIGALRECLGCHGVYLAHLGRQEEADALHDRVLEMSEKLVEIAPDNAFYWVLLGGAQNNVAFGHGRRGDGGKPPSS
jgi:tetratricopeptide (TPR) repeat protein